MREKICMVTGATSGIGLETALGLARQGATVVVAGRDAQKGAATVACIQQKTGNGSVDFLLADLSEQAQVRRMAQEFQARYARLHVLVNNAGAFFGRRRESASGIEMTWAVNLLAPFLLTNLLLDSLRAGAPARVINVSSDIQRVARIDLDDLQGRSRYSGMRAYGQSKLALILFTYELARRAEGSGVAANAVHPGFAATNIGQSYGRAYRLFQPLMGLMAKSAEEGAQTSLYVASSPEVEGVSGKYFKDCLPVPSAPISYDEETAGRLWAICAGTTGL